MTKKEITVVGWKVGTLSADLASVRYRAILPIIALRDEGITSHIFDNVTSIDLTTIDALIIVKSFTAEDLILAQQAAALGKKVLFDLCDNIFIEDYRGKQATTPAEMFASITPYLSAITVTTAPLKDVVDNITKGQVPSFIVPDGIEGAREFTEAKSLISKAVKSNAKMHLRETFNSLKKASTEKKESFVEIIKHRKHHFKKDLRNILRPVVLVNKLYTFYDLSRAKITGRPRKTTKPIPFFSNEIYLCGKKISKKQIPSNIKRVVWFGNHGAKYAQFGILDLLAFRRALEKAHQTYQLELVVVSNNKERFQKHIAPFNCFTRYVEWSSTAVDQILGTSNACLIPNSKDAFSICKSANRTVLALNANIPVIATLTPALTDLAEAIYHEDPYQALIECFEYPHKAKQKITLGKKLIKELYGKRPIAQALLNALSVPERSTLIRPPSTARIILAINLIQDYELAKPLIEKLAEQQSLAVWISASLGRKAPKILEWLTNEKLPYACFPDDIAAQRPNIFKEYLAEKFVTFAETNLGPHRFTHTLTKLANENNVETFTFQHGLENIGLTYSDHVHNIASIDIAASKILTWGPPSTLHPEIKHDIKSRIFPVGCVKPAQVSTANSTPIDNVSGPVVGIFENLHWHRYSAQYQDDFISALEQCASRFTNITFFIKPHPAGMWLTTRFKGRIPENSNIVIAAPTDPSWERPLLGDYLRKLSGVISTPSTIVLDAARAHLPTLVCGFGLELDTFYPLKVAEKKKDWIEFIDDLFTPRVEAHLRNNSEFLARNLIAGDAVEKAVNLICDSYKGVL